MKKQLKSVVLALAVLALGESASAQNTTLPVKIEADFASKSSGKLDPIWAFFGYDEPNYTYMKDGKKLLSEIAAASPVPVFVRTHSLLTSGDGIPSLRWGSTNAYTEDAAGNPIYNWSLIDSIFDTYVNRGMKPLAQIGFMPEAMSTIPESNKEYTNTEKKKVVHYGGWNAPPKSYEKYAELVSQWVNHSIQRYGKQEVESWYWELWNEPDISYWRGTTEEYIKLYDYVSHAVKKALPTAKIGGPETTNPGSANAAKFLRTFLDHIVSGKNYVTGKKGAPLDFITFHAKGDPRTTNGVVTMNMGVQLRHIDKGFEIISSYPSLKKLPIIIGESDPEGCAGCPEDFYPNNAYRNGTMYSSYTAVAFSRTRDLAKNRGVNLLGAVTWAFEFEDQPWFRGFRDLATNGVDKPVLNVFKMFGMMNGNRINVTGGTNYSTQMVRDSSVRKGPDVNAIAAIDGTSASILTWNYHDVNDVKVPPTPVNLTLKGLPGRVMITQYLVDQSHSNSFEAWKKMGSPKAPSAEQYKELERAGQLQTVGSPHWVTTKGGQTELSLDLERQGVYLVKIDW